MRKCPDCTREIDKYGIACQYCGRSMGKELTDKEARANSSSSAGSDNKRPRIKPRRSPK